MFIVPPNSIDFDSQKDSKRGRSDNAVSNSGGISTEPSLTGLLVHLLLLLLLLLLEYLLRLSRIEVR